MSARTGWKANAALFLVSQCVTLFGSTLVQMAIVWFATVSTASGAWVAAFSVCASLPQLALSLPGGVWADRLPRRALIAGADLSIAAVTLAMILFGPSDGPTLLGGLLALLAVRSVGAGVQTPAVNASVALLVPEDGRMRFNGFNAAMQSAVQFAAPAAAGLALTAGSLRAVLWIDVLTAAAGVALLSRVRFPARAAAPQAAARGGLTGGFRSILRERDLRRLMAVYALFVLMSVPGGYLAGLYVSRAFGDSYGHLAAVELAGFAGMAAGGLAMGLWGGFASRERTLRAALAAFGALSILMGAAGSLPVYLALMFLYGMAMTAVQTAALTLMQQRAAPGMQGRLFGVAGAVQSGMMPLGMAVFGPMADRLSLRWLMMGAGAVLLCAAWRLRRGAR